MAGYRKLRTAAGDGRRVVSSSQREMDEPSIFAAKGIFAADEQLELLEGGPSSASNLAAGLFSGAQTTQAGRDPVASGAGLEQLFCRFTCYLCWLLVPRYGASSGGQVLSHLEFSAQKC